MELVRTSPGDSHYHWFENFLPVIYPENRLPYLRGKNAHADFLQGQYLVMNSGMAVARFAIYNNPWLNYKNLFSVSIGQYECIEDETVSTFALNEATNIARALKASFVIGPMNGSTWDTYRFTDAFDQPLFLQEQEHPLYYHAQFSRAGFEVIAKYNSSIDRSFTRNQHHVLLREEELTQEGLRIREIDIHRYEEELTRLHPFILEAFQRNFLYTPIALPLFLKKYLEVKPMVNAKHVLIAEDAAENIVGFIFCYDDLYNTTEKSLVIKTIARKMDAQWKGLGHILANRIIDTAAAENYQSLIHAFIIENGTSAEASRNFAGEVFKHYSLYAKPL
jgi:L-amino acid N-acyltransferase YncA